MGVTTTNPTQVNQFPTLASTSAPVAMYGQVNTGIVQNGTTYWADIQVSLENLGSIAAGAVGLGNIAPQALVANTGTASGTPGSLFISNDLTITQQSTISTLSSSPSIARIAGVHRHFATVSALGAYVPSALDISLIGNAGVSADVQGYWVRNDFGGGSFDLVPQGNYTPDGFSYFPSATSGYGWARRMPSWGVCPEMAGAVGNYSYALWLATSGARQNPGVSPNVTVENSAPFTAIVNYANGVGGLRIVLSPGAKYYLLFGIPEFGSGVILQGHGANWANGTWPTSRIVLDPTNTLSFGDGSAKRDLLTWRAGLPEGVTLTLAQVRSQVLSWTQDNGGGHSAVTATTIADMPQGGKGGASACLTFAGTLSGVYNGWSVQAAATSGLPAAGYSGGGIPPGALVEGIATTVTAATSAAQGAPGIMLQFAPASVTVVVGEPVSAAGVPAGTTVAGSNYQAGIVTLSAPTTAALASGATVTFGAGAAGSTTYVEISMGAIYGDVPSGTVITFRQPSLAVCLIGDVAVHNCAIIGFHTGYQYLSNSLIFGCTVDCAGIAYECYNNGGNGIVSHSTANGVWANSVSGSDGYGGAGYRPGVGFMNHAQSGGNDNTGASYIHCNSNGYAHPIVLKRTFVVHADHFSCENTPNNGLITYGILTQNDCEDLTFVEPYVGTNHYGLGMYHNTLVSRVTFIRGHIITVSATLPQIDCGPGSAGAFHGTLIGTSGSGALIVFDPNILAWDVIHPVLSGGPVPTITIPSGADGKVCIVFTNTGIYGGGEGNSGDPNILIIPNLPTAAPAIPGQLYVNPNGGLVQVPSSGIGIGQDRRATTTAQGTITLADLGHTVFVAIGTTAAQEIYLPPLPALGTPVIQIVDDQGVASPTLPIVVNANGANLINNAGTAVIESAGGSLKLKAGATCWRFV